MTATAYDETVLEAVVDGLREAILEAATPDELARLTAALRGELAWRPLPHQQPPPGDWWTWLFQGGRGTGKTGTGAHWLDEHMKGPPCNRAWPGGHKAAMLGPTHGDGVASMFRGATGLRALNPNVRLVGRKEGTFVVWPGGAEAVVLGMHTEEDTERIRAQAANVCTWWVDEGAIGRHLAAAIDMLALAARGSARPHGVMTTTPKPTAAYKAFKRRPGVVVTRGSIYDNPFLPEAYLDVIAQFKGSRLGRQELYGDDLDDYLGALWTRDTLDRHRVRELGGVPVDRVPPLERLAALSIVRSGVGIDPSTWIPTLTPGDEDAYDGGQGVETGIVVAGIDRRNPPHVYVLDDLSGRLAATRWAERATGGYHDWSCAWVVPETNAGGDMVLATIQLTDPTVTVYHEVKDGKRAARPGVRASVGKRARAEPVAALYEQGRAHHVGDFPVLESTLTGWDPTEAWSPDRMDALVWAVTALAPWRRRSSSGAGHAGRTISR